MKTIVLLSLLGLAALTANAQTAPNAANDSMVTISGAKSDTAAQVRAMLTDEFSRYVGSYELSNGDSLALFTRGLKKYAAFHGEAWHEIVATSANTFVSKDQQLKIDIHREDNGVVHGDLYMSTNPTQTAAGGGAMVKVAFH